ncbi:MAG: NADH-quinone oxidoreductase subunit H [Desulfomicrobium sp.]|nr:NADH-quinone oxidoreductase subunit H [Pseudomonadota bacterium]MBU4569985.1 NADH-quinone oxidoreductase subunit H [Pseudomonadota bacterium]MBU4595084.1 NADH-quinone oxidoreductase subunit H [Pseudomonadota bacterium]MBV1711314.1 NADH-quinone oxidoreductase subunit H [Desulfomicrobium sp.]MBV1746968.1 NADH-quinone oxidoreductase subunit H [Desulfomicrobium sp.]
MRLDEISAFFLLLLCVVGAAGAIYCRSYWPQQAHPRSAGQGRLWWSALLTSMGLVLTQSNGLHFLLAWESFALSAYFLVTLDRKDPAVRSAGWLYLGASHAGTLALFGFFAALAAQTGSWELGPMTDQASLAPLFWIALLGFGIKAGVFPLHIWLPSAHASAPSHVSAIMSGVAIKMGIYGLVRFSTWLPLPVEAGWVVVGLGCASAVLGVAFALGQHDLKRLLAYHSVENIGIILIGLGFAMIALDHGRPQWGLMALAGGLLHVWNHGLFKALLFLGAGAVLHSTGTREMSRMGGLWKAMPWTASLFTLGAVAICGLPPLNGFVSEWLVYRGLFDAARLKSAAAVGAVPAAILLAVTGALALACFVKVCGVVFLGAARTKCAQDARECDAGMRAGMAILAAGCLAVGLAPAFIWPSLLRVAQAWLRIGPVPGVPNHLEPLGVAHPLLALAILALGAAALAMLRGRCRRAVTWDCGYSAPSARMQYSAGSFAGIITAWFAWILRPVVRADLPVAIFPARSAINSHTPETVLESVIYPAGNRVLRVADFVRTFQHGRVQSYLIYLCAALVVLAVAVILYTE